MQGWLWKRPDANKKLPGTQSYLRRTVSETENKAERCFTFSEVFNPLSIYRDSMLIRIGSQKMTEVTNNRSTDAFVGNPLDDRFGLDISQLFQRQFL